MSIYPDDLEEIRDAIVVAAAIQAAATVYSAHRQESGQVSVEEAAEIAVAIAVTTAKTMAGTK